MRPLFVAIFTTVCMLALGAVCAFFPVDGIPLGHTILQMPTLTDVMGTRAEEPAIEADEVSTTIVAEDVLSQDTVSIARGEYAYMEAFYQALPTAQYQSIRVMHYGDSQIECDRMTRILRQALQNRYGGGGVGLIPVIQTIPTYSLSQSLSMNNDIQDAQTGPKRYLAYGPKSMRRTTSHYGPMAQVTVMNDSLVQGSEDIIIHLTTRKKGPECYFNRIRVLRSEKDSMIIVRDSTSQYNLRLRGKGDIYGISLENEHGIVVDNIPMRGCSGTMFTSISPSSLQSFYASSNTRLIILQYGGNVMPYTKSFGRVRTYCDNIRRQIQFLRRCAPDAAILFIGPSDMLSSAGDQRKSYTMLPSMDASLQKVAHEEGIAYWSLFKAMGGSGSMNQWIQNGLAASDGVHFTNKGAQHAGELLTEWILKGIEEK